MPGAFRPAAILIIGLGILVGCRAPSKSSAWRAVGTSSGISLERVTERRFVVRVQNNSPKPVVVDTYYFGYVLEVKYRNGRTRRIEFGSDKVPAPIDSDWKILKTGQSIAWSVGLPENFENLDEATEIIYSEDGTEQVVPAPLRSAGTLKHIDGRWVRT